ncbi:hypothetical protein NEPAR06_1064 [Nematocida parisii]|uniref:Uncharacterized protein n=1 Tax=Nematocida parisii (strain ERTm3) TaxID=935791 RepID=I3EGF6_NEMP3|nr:uncharacterized protein NEPG_01203 [Nematocida parisii ERTm1]EIJ88303.1 hypothetical protein NEQG_01747 [Nematocida parisii ERTm3]KAI5125432.1 hypothetical protein NEPAR03_0107 [Nematocida parisii]EIJ93631.1 hypothetical protein NEPG_01203 [Nematocida parisii ERTm1]KAI5125556.1 hypothetical protein NEPAR08_0107 [Nematocida parisii]KAI5141823.1 hypothetical protein NEPAR04_1210 [Nematocida parisii]|eukprot:XP_013059031.1 hypothetical protein NEPG_01203 [Nematocida parisii ERTm1]
MEIEKTVAGNAPPEISVPSSITLSILSVAFATTYPTILSCIMSDPDQVFISLLAGAFSFLTIPGTNSRAKLIGASVLSLPLFFIVDGYLRAFLIGFLQAYGQTVAEIHTAHLSLFSFREAALSQLGILLTMQTCMIFFFLSFLPGFEGVCKSFIFVFCLIMLEVLAVVLLVPEPPSEMIVSNNLNVLYNEVYYALTKLLGNTPFYHFHREYTELVDKYNKPRVPAHLKISTILEKVNISFISTGVGGLLSTTTNNIYLIIYCSLSMFKWVFSNQHNKEYIILSTVSVGIVLLTMIVYNVKPIFIILIGMSLYLVPSSEGYLQLDKCLIGVSNSIRNALGMFVFMILWREQVLG